MSSYPPFSTPSLLATMPTRPSPSKTSLCSHEHRAVVPALGVRIPTSSSPSQSALAPVKDPAPVLAPAAAAAVPVLVPAREVATPTEMAAVEVVRQAPSRRSPSLPLLPPARLLEAPAAAPVPAPAAAQAPAETGKVAALVLQ